MTSRPEGPLARARLCLIIVMLLGATCAVSVLTLTPTAGSAATHEVGFSYRPAVGGPTVALAPTSGYVGANLTVTGGGYPVNSNLNVTFNDTGPMTACASNATGNFSCFFAVPGEPAASYLVNVTNLTTTASATFQIDPPTLVLIPADDQVGSNVTASGAGYEPLTSLQLSLDGTTVPCQAGGGTANGTGNFSCTFQVPALVAPGPYLFNASDGYNLVNASFTVDPPSLTLNPTSGAVGTQLNAYGAGYAPGVTVNLLFGTQPITCSSGSLLANPYGQVAQCRFSAPTVKSGVVPVNASDGYNTGYANFTVSASTLSLSHSQGNVSESIVATGSGFAYNTALSLTFGTTGIPSCKAGSLTTDGVGDLDCTFTVPAATGGAYSVVASDGVNPASHTFTVKPKLDLSVGSGNVGTVGIALGTGFDGTSAYAVEWNLTTTLCSGTTDSTGNFTCDLAPIPPAPEGKYLLTVTEGTYNATAPFSVLPGLSLNPEAGSVGTSVDLIGTGLVVSDTYSYCFLPTANHCSAGAPTFSAGVSGSAPGGTMLTIPSDAPGSYFVDISQSSTLIANASFTLTSASVVLAPDSGTVGTVITLGGSGYGVDATYDYCFQTAADACPASGSGSFVSNGTGGIPSGVAITVPETPEGNYYVDVSTGTSFVAGGEFTLLPAVVLSPSAGSVGSEVSAPGTGFDASTSYTVTWDTSLILCSGVTDASGDFACSFVVPSSTAGAQTVAAVEGAVDFQANFTVIPTLALVPTSGAVGSSGDASGTGFGASTTVVVTWDSVTTLGSASTNGTGSFAFAFTVPTATAGSHNITASEGSNSAIAVFRVTPTFTVDPTSASVGAMVSVSGDGFDADAPFSLEWNATTTFCASSDTTPSGGLSCTFMVPAASSGTITLTLHEGTYAPTATFTVGASLILSPSSGVVGSGASASGEGFTPDLGYTVSWDSGGALCAGVTTSVGAFGCTFTVPIGPGGIHTVTVVQGSNTATASYTATPLLTVSAATDTVGSAVTVTGEGFSATLGYSVSWNSTTTLCSGTTDSSGNLACTFHTPPSPGGTTTVTVVSGSFTLTASVSVGPSLSLSATSGQVGTQVTATGAGFAAGASFSVTWNTATTLCSGTTNSNGGFSCSFAIPSSAPGSYTVSVGGVSSPPSGTFTVTSSNHSVPPPATPFPWWVVGVVAVVVVILLLLALVAVRRRTPGVGSGSGPRTVQPWDGSPAGGTTKPSSPSDAGSPAGSSAPTAAVAAAPEVAQDIDVLIDRLEQMSMEMFKKTPKQLSEQSTEAPGEEKP